MASKRTLGIDLIENPFIKKKNLEWTIDLPGQVEYTVPADQVNKGREQAEKESATRVQVRPTQPATADVEAGNAQVEDHLAYFSGILERATLSPYPDQSPHLPVANYQHLYNSNSGNAKGSHFIIHQHDHPVAGTHYDLRLQINETSSASWAIMYGLPGDPNSVRLNRNATETRIHCLWNHLIETASVHTGSLLIWDTGTYSILPRRSKYAPAIDPDSERSSSSSECSPASGDEHAGGTRTSRRRRVLTEQEKLHRAFANRKIRLQLHGTRLPENYVLNLRLTRSEDAAGRQRSRRSAGKAPRKRRRRGLPTASEDKKVPIMTSSDEEEEGEEDGKHSGKQEDKDEGEEDVDAPIVQADQHQGISALEKELRELEDEDVRRTNAYTGAQNSIGSVHQRRWYLSLDREACGFTRRYRGRHEGPGKNGKKVEWVRKETRDKGVEAETHGHQDERDDGRDGRLDYPFYVRGVDVERSVVTGRRGADILRDEGVVEYVNRQGWRPALN
ncbi:DNA polymerase ligase-domain-containing protein [Microdochium trichocladiopsis]|uniref:DNA polymerase ligase-domain-containing protein n=1 Tax=Microdochium trichocladiopsis TaxID=1682393 RepID=A0A9P9BRW4_9PEZI|nr:DNA polymerase ligase-domain-containing protein [Microdochium trichocladiopsis]KAH7027700.1 DNA polymerase ligase-domain-containing protein [Microdochium trichocladiopsis]